MVTSGTFGYIIGKKKRMMYVDNDADLLWQVLVREIYVLMKHYGSKEALQMAFESIKTTKNKPKAADIQKLKVFTDLTVTNESENDWYCLLRHCQNSFINILEAGYILNQKDEYGLVFLLDFNKGSVSYYGKNYDKSITNFETATIEEIMEFDDMPTKTYTEIVSEMKDRFEKYDKKINMVDEEIKKINDIINKANEMGGEQNIIQKAKVLLDDMKWQHKKLELDYRYFYHRMDALNLIIHDEK
jgi:hypothetical protein